MTMPKGMMRRRLATLLLAGAVIAAPVSLRLDGETGLRMLPAMAHAKDGDRGGNDRGGDDRGGRDDRGGDDRGGRDRGSDDRGGHGRDDRGRDDRGRDDHGRRDDDRRDHGGRGRGRDDHPGRAGGGMGSGLGGGHTGSRPTEVERSARGIEVTYADGWREELENGRYELKDAQGRTVVERRATGQDVARLSSFAR